MCRFGIFSPIAGKEISVKMSKIFFGTCALTGKSGQFVKSHLIPRALTRLSRNGEKYIQSGIGESMRRVSDSWYDLKLVVKEGEDILSAIDDVGIRQLRENHLVWSGWGQHESLRDVLGWDSDSPMRSLRLQNSGDLRLFFLSLLWRAGASRLPDFKDVTLTPEEIEDLRQRVFKRDPGAQADYPIVLHQISTRGAHHNRTPLLEETTMEVEGEPEYRIVYVRFYFEGLVARIYLGSRTNIPTFFSKVGINDEAEFVVFLNDFENSRTKTNLVSMMHDYAERRGAVEQTALAP